MFSFHIQQCIDKVTYVMLQNLQTDTTLSVAFFAEFKNNNRKWSALIQLLQVFIIGADFALSGSTAWIYTLDMNKRRILNNELLYGILNASYAIPTLFLGGFLTNIYRNEHSRKSKTPFIMFGTQTAASIGSVFYTCSFSPFLVILGRTCQGFIGFSLLSTHQKAEATTTTTTGNINSINNTIFHCREVLFSLGIILSSIFISFAASFHQLRLGKLNINFGNIWTVYIFVLTLAAQIIIAGFIQKNRKSIAVHMFSWRRYGSIANKFKNTTCKDYQKLQEGDMRKVQLLSQLDFRSRASWLEKLIYISRQPNSQVPYILFLTAHGQFSITLTVYILPLFFVNESFKRQYLGASFGVFGVSCLITRFAVWFKIVSFQSRFCQVIILLYPWFLLSCIASANHIKYSELRLAYIFTCFVLTGSLRTIVQTQYKRMMTDPRVFSSVDKKIIDIYDFDRLHSILSNMLTIAATMLSGFVFKYYFWFCIILFVSNTTTVLACYCVKKRRRKLEDSRSNGPDLFNTENFIIRQRESFL